MQTFAVIQLLLFCGFVFAEFPDYSIFFLKVMTWDLWLYMTHIYNHYGVVERIWLFNP